MGRREQIISCARELIEERGLSKTSVSVITERMGVTRTLFYHYFPSKDELVSAVLDDYVSEFVEAIEEWNSSRKQGDIEGSLSSMVALLRRELFDEKARKPFRRALATKENASLYLQFINRAADATAKCITNSTVLDYERFHEVRIEHIYETFYVLALGIIGYMRQHPNADDEILKDLIAQTLHMDRGNQNKTKLKAKSTNKKGGQAQ